MDTREKYSSPEGSTVSGKILKSRHLFGAVANTINNYNFNF